MLRGWASLGDEDGRDPSFGHVSLIDYKEKVQRVFTSNPH